MLVQQPARRGRQGEKGECPICNKLYNLGYLQQHADRCFAKLERRSQQAAAAAAATAPPRKRPAPKSSSASATKQRVASAPTCSLPTRALTWRPHVLFHAGTSSSRHSHTDEAPGEAASSSFAIQRLHVGDIEFRCQSYRAQNRARAGVAARTNAAAAPATSAFPAFAALAAARASSRGRTLAWAGCSNNAAAPLPLRPPQPLQAPESLHVGRDPAAITVGEAGVAASSAAAAAAGAEDEAVGEGEDEEEERFLSSVKAALEPSALERFMDVLVSFQRGTLDTAQLMKEIATLLAGHTELLLGLDQFLPPDGRYEVLDSGSAMRSRSLCYAADEPPRLAVAQDLYAPDAAGDVQILPEKLD